MIANRGREEVKKMGENMNNQKIKEEEKTKQYKVTVSKTGFERVEEFLLKVNETSKRKIKMSDVLDFAVEKLAEKDIPKIQERVYTADEKMEAAWEEHNRRNPDRPMTLEQYKTAALEALNKLYNKALKAKDDVSN
ncbi:MAG: hypothetical protein ABL958_02620 [Bdellovibrionia bacterium]